MENLVDESVPEHRDASSSSHELPTEPRAKVVRGKHSLYSLPEGPKLPECWNADEDRELSETWTGFTRFTFS